MQTSNDDRIAYRPAEAARLLGISRSAIYEAMARGEIVGRKLGVIG
jgi:excisionase family DNA binding protein